MLKKIEKKEDLIKFVESYLWPISAVEKLFLRLASFTLQYTLYKWSFVKFEETECIERYLKILALSTSYIFLFCAVIICIISGGISLEKTMMVIGGGLLGYYLPFTKYKKILSDKEKLIQREFPIVIDRLLILLDAGYSTAMAWELMSGLLNNGSEIDLEVGRIIKQMKLGVSEEGFYKELQERLNYLLVIKFCSICSQNIRKGGADLRAQLKELSDEAMLERRWTAIKAGEEASTKMIIPLSLIFIGVLILIMIPAALQLTML